MAVTLTDRLGVPQWSAGSDPFTRAQMNAAFAALEAAGAKFLPADTFANRPAAAAANAWSIFHATDNGHVYLSTGVAWIRLTSDVALVDAKGDLLVGAAADTFGRLAVGANGTVLTAASGETTGTKWSQPTVTLLASDEIGQIGGNGSTAEFTAYSFTVPANTLGANGHLELDLNGFLTNGAGSTTTFTIRVKFGATTLATFTAAVAAAAAERPFDLNVRLHNSATNAQYARSRLLVVDGSGLPVSTEGGVRHAAATEDTTGNKALAVTIQPSQSNGSISCGQRGVTLELLKPAA